MTRAINTILTDGRIYVLENKKSKNKWGHMLKITHSKLQNFFTIDALFSMYNQRVVQHPWCNNRQLSSDLLQ